MPSANVSAKNIAILEGRIGHAFKTHERLVRALTHASATKSAGEISHYERLEFLGDRVLGLCVAELLFSSFPNAREGELSVRLNTLVSGNTCAQVADEIGLHDFIFAGADIKHLASKRMQSVRADVVESLIAAIYLDAGLDAAKSFVQKYWGQRIHQAGAAISDSKTSLQEWSHINTNGTPVYSIVDRTGPDHDPVFVVKVEVENVQTATGRGRSKRTAEQAAAETVLLREGAWVKNPDGTIKKGTK